MSGRSEDDAEAWQIWLRITVEIDRAVARGIAHMPETAWRVLVHLATRPDRSEPTDIDAIGEACAISPATVSRALASLESVGYIAKGRSDQDGRLVDRGVTRAGWHALGKIKHAADSPS